MFFAVWALRGIGQSSNSSSFLRPMVMARPAAAMERLRASRPRVVVGFTALRAMVPVWGRLPIAVGSSTMVTSSPSPVAIPLPSSRGVLSSMMSTSSPGVGSRGVGSGSMCVSLPYQTMISLSLFMLPMTSSPVISVTV